MSLRIERCRVICLQAGAVVGVAIGLAACVGPTDRMRNSDVQEYETVLVQTGEYAVSLPAQELPELEAALRKAVADTKAPRESRVPEPYIPVLAESVAEAGVSAGDGQIRAGEWMLVTDGEGLAWQNRPLLPEGGGMGVMFEAPLEKGPTGWVVPQIVFKRLR